MKTQPTSDSKPLELFSSLLSRVTAIRSQDQRTRTVKLHAPGRSFQKKSSTNYLTLSESSPLTNPRRPLQSTWLTVRCIKQRPRPRTCHSSEISSPEKQASHGAHHLYKRSPLGDLPSSIQPLCCHLSQTELNSEVELTLLAPSQQTC